MLTTFAFGKVEVEGTMFLYIESIKDPLFFERQRSKRSMSQARSWKIIDLFTLEGGGGHVVQERSHLGQICAMGDILTPARNRFLPLLDPQIPTLWYISGEGGVGGGGH
jgi:hypothetical protein